MLLLARVIDAVRHRVAIARGYPVPRAAGNAGDGLCGTADAGRAPCVRCGPGYRYDEG
jgi:hypothetical protein